MKLRLASYNVHKCLGTDRVRSAGRVLDVINEIEADVIAVQEADHRLGPRRAALPAKLVEAGSDFVVAPLALSPVSLGWHGNAILLRRTMALHRVERLLLPGLEPRGAVAVEFGGPRGPVRLVGVHLGLIRRYRLMQLYAIRAALSVRAAMPTVILGDFNEWASQGGMEPLADAFHVHAPGRSFHASRPVAALDRIALGRDVHLKDAGVIETPLSRAASDHLPVWADVGIGPEP